MTNLQDLSLPSPLAEVLNYEGYVSTNCISQPSCTLNPNHFRFEFFGLPGMGKSTLCQGIVNKLKDDYCILYIPEAVNYAVEVLGIELTDAGEFIGKFNDQAEILAMKFVKSTPLPTIILKDPSIIQNQIYRYIQKCYVKDRHFTKILSRFQSVQIKDITELSNEIWPFVCERIIPYVNDLLLDPFRNYIWITTQIPTIDIEISLVRQKNIDRNPKLVTSNLALLLGYLSSIQKVFDVLQDKNISIVKINPSNTIEVQSKAIVNLIEKLSYKKAAIIDNRNES